MTGSPADPALWGAPHWLGALAGVPILALLLLMAARARRRSVEQFADRAAWDRLGLAAGRTLGVCRAAALFTAITCLCVAVARPRGNPRTVEGVASGRDVVFLIDVSRSMLATDLPPTRLDRAKLWIKDVVATLRGDRVALVAFAGTPVVKCPLTLDYPFFSGALDELSPSSVSRGGSLIGDAIRTAVEDLFKEEEPRPRDIILITDGEDQESFPVEAAQQAAAKNIRIIAIGLGDPSAGAAVPDEQGKQLTRDGHRIVTRQDAATLEAIAAASNQGVYLNVGTGTIELDRVYQDLVGSAAKAETTGLNATVYDEYFQPLIGTAAALLLAEFLLASIGRKPKRHTLVTSVRHPG